jgi:hypothetical protein
LLIGLLTLTGAAPTETTVPAPTGGVSELIDQLASRSFRERETAERELDRLGEPVLVALWEAARTAPDPESRRRAASLAARIELRAEANRLLAPTHVHLVCRDIPLSEAVAELARQSEQTVTLDPQLARSPKRVTLDTGKVSFWEAVDRLCQVAGLTDASPTAMLATNPQAGIAGVIQIGNRGAVPVAVPVNKRTAQAAAGGVVLSESSRPPAGSHGRSISIRAEANPMMQAGEIPLTLSVRTEPRFGVRNLRAIELESAEDERGRELAVLGTDLLQTSSRTEQIQVINGRQVVMIREQSKIGSAQTLGRLVRLRRPAGGATEIRHLRGRALIEFLTPIETLSERTDLADPAAGPVEGKNGVNLRVRSSKPLGNGQYTQEIELSYTTQTVEPAMTTNSTHLRGLDLISEDGSSWQISGVSSTRTRVVNGHIETTATVTWQPNQAGATPHALRFLGRRTVVLDVPFEIESVQLP